MIRTHGDRKAMERNGCRCPGARLTLSRARDTARLML